METPVALTSWRKLFPLLNERQRRLDAAQKVLELGYGGLKQVQDWTGLSRPTLLKGLAELRGGGRELNRSGFGEREVGARRSSSKRRL